VYLVTKVAAVLMAYGLQSVAGGGLAGFDIAKASLACAMGLPGSENLDRDACFAWIDRAVAWTWQHTERTIGRFLEQPEAFHYREAIFRIVALYEVLQQGLKIRYAAHRIGDNASPWPDSRDHFIHGPISGYGGTCLSLPILVIAVGRRLGYPLKLVATQGHFFARWDGSDGVRFNIDGHASDSASGGPNIRPDDYYLGWPYDIRGQDWESTHYLKSMDQRQELACLLIQRGICLGDGGDLAGAVKSIAEAVSLCQNDVLWKKCLKTEYLRWETQVGDEIEASPHWRRLKGIRIIFPRRQRYPGLGVAEEQSIIRLELWERFLRDRSFMLRLAQSSNPGHLVINCQS
jgi:hypothetical protein